MTEQCKDLRSRLPKMDKLLAWPEIQSLTASSNHTILRNTARTALDSLRHSLRHDPETDISRGQIIRLIQEELHRHATASLKRVINGSGVVIHTNLGRSPLPEAAKEALLLNAACGYNNLELNLELGERGERYVHVEKLLCELTGAEAALVVNNNAAAVLLTLSALAANREVVVSRGELVEIGGSFRIPDVMIQSGATLVEVGTTNRTHPKDYHQAITGKTALLLKVHTSNFAIVGFTTETGTAELVAIAREAEIPVMIDAGSGCLVDLTRFGINGETPVPKHIKDGADLVTFSGDKLLGGPQAGIIIGKKKLISQIKCHPLLRALRIDKLSIAALEATLRLYQNEQRAMIQIPTLHMLTIPSGELARKARRILRSLRSLLPSTISLTLRDGVSTPGGGSFPLLKLPTRLIEISLPSTPAHHLETALRSARPPVIGRLQRGCFMLDVRTLCDSDLPLLANSLRQVLEAINA